MNNGISLPSEAREINILTERVLEYLYHLWKGGKPGDAITLCAELGLTRKELREILEYLARESYIEIPVQDSPLSLTQAGLDRAFEQIQRKSYLYSLLRDVCNVREESARENAEEINRIVSDDVVEGIRDYVMQGNRANRVIREEDLCLLYEPGHHMFDMSLYDTKTISPRILCREYEIFSSDIELIVTDRESWFLLSLVEGSSGGSLWYLKDQKWHKTALEGQKFRLPTNCFVYTITNRIPMKSGEAFVAYVPEGEELGEDDIRALEVHLW